MNQIKVINFHYTFVLRVSRLPPILSLIYDYDENGVLLKRQQDMNGTMIDLDDDLFIPVDNLTMLWNISKNESVQMEDILSLHNILQGINNRISDIFKETYCVYTTLMYSAWNLIGMLFNRNK